MTPPRRLIFQTMFGSHLYGTATPTSDRDYKGVALSTDIEILMMKDFGMEMHGTGVQHKRNTSEDTDHEVYSLRKFVGLLAQGNIMALDILFAYQRVKRAGQVWPIFRILWEGRGHFLTKNTAAFAGYCKQQAAKYGLAGTRCRAALQAYDLFVGLEAAFGPDYRLRDILAETGQTALEFVYDNDLTGYTAVISDDSGFTEIEILNKRFPLGARLKHVTPILERIASAYGERVRQAERNEGIDWKAMSHALRVCYEAQELMRTGHITLPLASRNRRMVLDVKEGRLPITEALDLINENMTFLEECKERSTLRDEVDQEWLDSFVQWAHLNVIRGMTIQ